MIITSDPPASGSEKSLLHKSAGRDLPRPALSLSKKAKGLFRQKGYGLPRAPFGHTCRPRSVIFEAHVPENDYFSLYFAALGRQNSARLSRERKVFHRLSGAGFYPLRSCFKSLFCISTHANWQAYFFVLQSKNPCHPDGWQGFLTQPGRKIHRRGTCPGGC